MGYIVKEAGSASMLVNDNYLMSVFLPRINLKNAINMCWVVFELNEKVCCCTVCLSNVKTGNASSLRVLTRDDKKLNKF